MLLLLFLTVASVNAVCPCPREDLKDCFSMLLDVNVDGNITLSELNTTMTAMMSPTGCFSDRPATWKQHYTAEFIMSACDVDQDNILTESDWDSPKSCDASPTASYWVCMFCAQCGWHGPAR
jgi:Ca2+-binding EF-hand superfamily protein